MTQETVGIVITIIGFLGTIFNVWLTARIRADIAEMKVWCMQTFATKAELDSAKADQRSAIQTYLSQGAMMRVSEAK